MIEVTILTTFKRENFTFYHTIFPLLLWKKDLLNIGYNIKITDKVNGDLFKTDIIVVVDYIVGPVASYNDLVLFEKIKKHNVKLIYFCTVDSAGTTRFEVMPYVDSYIKKQVYIDKSIYTRHVYSLRLFSEFIHVTFGVEDRFKVYRHPCEPQYLPKIKVSWNIGFGPYGLSNKYLHKLNVLNYRLKLPIKNMIKNNIINKSKEPCLLKNKQNEIHYRGKMNYTHETITYGRSQINKILKELTGKYNILFNSRVSKNIFYDELLNSKLTISPFGYGEICYRDFESFINNSVLLKPNMSHLETWPDWYIENKTYISYKWDFSDLTNKIEYVLSNLDEMQGLVCYANKKFSNVYSYEGKIKFLEHFQNLMLT